MTTPVLSVAELSVSFRTPHGIERAVDGVSFELQRGEIAGLVGESGCGKSVTALAILGLIPPERASVTAASISLSGSELLGLSDKSLRDIRGNEIAMIFQEPATALDPVFTIGWQISEVIRRHRRIGRGAARELAVQALGQGGFPDPGQVYQAYPHHLSGGMRQLAMIAMAMAVQPRVLIADEPTTALDVTTQSLILDRLLNLRDTAGTAILLVSHDLGVVASCCARVLVMYCGRVLEQAAYREFHAHPRHPYSSGLLSSVPRVHKGGPDEVQAGVTPIPGQVPPLSELPGGCHFAPRCKRSDEQCTSVRPRLEALENSVVACHHPL